MENGNDSIYLWEQVSERKGGRVHCAVVNRSQVSLRALHIFRRSCPPWFELHRYKYKGPINFNFAQAFRCPPKKKNYTNIHNQHRKLLNYIMSLIPTHSSIQYVQWSIKNKCADLLKKNGIIQNHNMNK